MNPVTSLISVFPPKIFYASALSLAYYMHCASFIISFSHPETSRLVLWPTQASCSVRSGVPSREWNGWGVLVATHMQLLLRLRMRRAIPLLPLCSFTVWTGKTLTFIVILLWTKFHRIQRLSLYCNFIGRNRVKLPRCLIATPWVRAGGSVGKVSSIVNLNVRSGDRLTSHPATWTSDPIWNGGKDTNSCPAYTSVPIFRQAGFTDVSRLTILRHRSWLCDCLQMDGPSSIPSRNIWNFAV
jgi:hypothetical protein